MKTIKVFTSITCPNCPPAKAMGEKLKESGQNVQMLSINEAEGLAEAQLFGVMAVPTIIITDENDQEIASWRNGLPSMEEIEESVKSKVAMPAGRQESQKSDPAFAPDGATAGEEKTTMDEL